MQKNRAAKKHRAWLSVSFLILIPFIFWNNFYFPNRLSGNKPIDKIEIIKSERILKIYQKENKDWKMIKSYSVALGKHPLGHKQAEGDYKTPEGNYLISAKKPHSSFHLSLEISYPNEQDKLIASQNNLNPGGKIMIHGILNGLAWIGKMHTLKDWTRGCIALTNNEINEIFEHTAVGTPVIIKP